MTSSFFSGKKVLVTGHTGFKGSWLSAWLKRLGADVVGYALPPEDELSLFALAGIERDMTSVMGDVTDLAHLTKVFSAHSPEIVFHLAAQALVRRSYRSAPETYATNVMGTLNVLEACRHTPGVRAVVVVTSDKCYENREWSRAYTEEDALGGVDPYSSSKACAEIVTASYRRSFFPGGEVGIASARAGNVIGGGDWSVDRLVPDIIRGVASGVAIPIRNPKAIRPWQHVLEPLAGYLTLAQHVWFEPAIHARAYNFGPSEHDALSVGDLAQRLVEVLGRGELKVERTAADAAMHEANVLTLDSSLAREKLKWKPVLSLPDAVDMTARWYRAYLEDKSAAAAMLDTQIAEYTGKLG